MTIKKKAVKFARTSMLIGLSSLLCIASTASSSWAKPNFEVRIKSAEQGSGTLRQGLPGRRLGGGTRNERLFSQNYAYLAALITSDNLGITTEERPTFIFSVPQMVEDHTAEFILRNENDELVYESTFPINREGGTITLDTASIDGMEALSLNETYRWYFSIIPDVSDRAKDAGVHGNIRRVDAEDWLAQQSLDSETLAHLANNNSLEQARALYQQANLWHDAAVALNKLRQAQPENTAIASEWNQLLEFAGLASIIETPETSIEIGLN